MNFGQYVKAKRLDLGLGLREFSTLHNIQASTQSRIESGILNPNCEEKNRQRRYQGEPNKQEKMERKTLVERMRSLRIHRGAPNCFTYLGKIIPSLSFYYYSDVDQIQQQFTFVHEASFCNATRLFRNCDVRFWLKADVQRHDFNVRFRGHSGRLADQAFMSAFDP